MRLNGLQTLPPYLVSSHTQHEFLFLTVIHLGLLILNGSLSENIQLLIIPFFLLRLSNFVFLFQNHHLQVFIFHFLHQHHIPHHFISLFIVYLFTYLVQYLVSSPFLSAILISSLSSQCLWCIDSYHDIGNNIERRDHQFPSVLPWKRASQQSIFLMLGSVIDRWLHWLSCWLGLFVCLNINL